jgi:hypothetical protein
LLDRLQDDLPRFRIDPIDPPIHSFVGNGFEKKDAFECSIKSVDRGGQFWEKDSGIVPISDLVESAVDYNGCSTWESTVVKDFDVAPIFDGTAIAGLTNEMNVGGRPRRQVVQYGFVSQQGSAGKFPQGLDKRDTPRFAVCEWSELLLFCVVRQGECERALVVPPYECKTIRKQAAAHL